MAQQAAQVALDILVIAMCAVMGGADSWEDTELSGQARVMKQCQE